MTAKQALLDAFDRLFDRAAARLQIDCSHDEKQEAKRLFADRFSAALSVVDTVTVAAIPEDVISAMENAIDHLSPAQLVGYLAAIPLAHQTHEMVRQITYRTLEQRALDHLITQASDQYGGN